MSSQGFLFSRARLKLLSLLFSFVLWLFVVMETGGEQEFHAEIRLISIRPGLAAAVVESPRLKVRLGGARTLLLRQKMIGLKCGLNLADYSAGEFKFQGLGQYLDIVPGLTLLSVAPDNKQVVITQK